MENNSSTNSGNFLPALKIQIKNSLLESVLVFESGILKDGKTRVLVVLCQNDIDKSTFLNSDERYLCYFNSCFLTEFGKQVLLMNITEGLVYFNLPFTF